MRKSLFRKDPEPGRAWLVFRMGGSGQICCRLDTGLPSRTAGAQWAMAFRVLRENGIAPARPLFRAGADAGDGTAAYRNMPPETSIRWPVIQPLPPVSRLAMAPPMSSGRPTRPIAVWAAMA